MIIINKKQNVHDVFASCKSETRNISLKMWRQSSFFVTTVGFMHTSFRYIAESGTCVEMQMRQALFTMFTLKKKSQNFRDV